MPNPYPIPGTPYSFDSTGPSDPIDPQRNVGLLVGYARSKISTHVQEHGDGLLPDRPREHGILYQLGGVSFHVSPTPIPQQQRITWKDAIAVLDTLFSLMKQDGYRSRRGFIDARDTGLFLGSAYLGADVLDNEVQNSTLQLHPIPNPYPLPNSDLSVDFDEPGQPLPSNHVFECIFRARRKVVEFIEEHGEGRVPDGLAYRWRSVEFRVFPEQHQRQLTLNDTLKVLTAYGYKNGQEGCRSRWATIVVTGAQPEQIIGTALLGPVVNGGISSHKPATA